VMSQPDEPGNDGDGRGAPGPAAARGSLGKKFRTATFPNNNTK
jgi:hypothetical protein